MSASYMKKWEEKNRIRNHQRRIQSAKSTVRKTTLANQKVVEIKSPAQTVYSHPSDNLDVYSAGDSSDTTRPSSSKLSDYFGFEKENLACIPLYRLLKHFSLQQYAKALISRGYGYNLAKLGTLGTDSLGVLLDDIKVLPGHRVKLTQLVSQIMQLCSEIIEQESMNHSSEMSGYKKACNIGLKPNTAQARPGGRQISHSTPKQGNKKPSSAIGVRRPLSTKTNIPLQQREENFYDLPDKGGINKDKKAIIVKLETIGTDYFADSGDFSNDDFSVILNDILDKYQHGDESTKEKLQSCAPLQPKKRSVQLEEPKDLMHRVDTLYGNEGKTKPTYIQAVKPQVSQKPVVQKLSLESKGKTKSNEGALPEPKAKKVILEKEINDKVLTKKFKEEEEAMETSPKMKARVMDLLEQKLDPCHLNKDDLNLEIKKIKDLYSSFDGAKMTSTIANIDIEEMCHCFACAIQKHIEHFIQDVLPAGDVLSVKVMNNQETLKDSNKENEKSLKINKAEPKEIIETKQKSREIKEQKRKEEIEYNEDDDYFIYKGKKIPIGGFEEKNVVQCQYEDLFDANSSDRKGSIYSKEEDEVMHNEEDEFYNDDFEDDDRNKKSNKITEKDSEENQVYDEEEFNHFLRQSLRENLLDTMKRGIVPSQDQIEAQRSRLDQVCQTKPHLQTLLVKNDKGKEEDVEEELDKESEEEQHSEFSFTMEESQYRELELSADEFDQVKRVKRLFEKTYNEKNLTPEEYNKRIKDTVGKETISNFCKNLMVTAKMEKEVIIVSLVYVERLIVKANMYLNSVNWKKICFIAFILASKIWDDESFENEHFAKVFPQHSTKDINELEKVFLELIDYDLRVSGSEYAKYYFILRTFAEKNKKSFALKPINVQVVRMLQNKVEGTTQSLKDKYLQNTNRSFA